MRSHETVLTLTEDGTFCNTEQPEIHVSINPDSSLVNLQELASDLSKVATGLTNFSAFFSISTNFTNIRSLAPLVLQLTVFLA